jgi:hypothetical protein
MIKLTFAACALCATAGGTALWVTHVSARHPSLTAEGAAATISIQEIQANVHMDSLPVVTIKDPL